MAFTVENNICIINCKITWESLGRTPALHLRYLLARSHHRKAASRWGYSSAQSYLPRKKRTQRMQASVVARRRDQAHRCAAALLSAPPLAQAAVKAGVVPALATMDLVLRLLHFRWRPESNYPQLERKTQTEAAQLAIQPSLLDLSTKIRPPRCLLYPSKNVFAEAPFIFSR